MAWIPPETGVKRGGRRERFKTDSRLLENPKERRTRRCSRPRLVGCFQVSAPLGGAAELGRSASQLASGVLSPVKAFISHNSADKETARLLAVELVELGVDVWFDEWHLRPGDSITGGIESGIVDCDAFILVWSANARRSKWVGTELRAALRRRVDDESMRVIPVMVDQTRLPALVADYRGFCLTKHSDLGLIARQIAGDDGALETAKRLQTRLLELIANEFPEDDAIRSLFCSRCGSDTLTARVTYDRQFDETLYEIVCDRCGCTCCAKAAGPALKLPPRGPGTRDELDAS